MEAIDFMAGVCTLDEKLTMPAIDAAMIVYSPVKNVNQGSASLKGWATLQVAAFDRPLGLLLCSDVALSSAGLAPVSPVSMVNLSPTLASLEERLLSVLSNIQINDRNELRIT